MTDFLDISYLKDGNEKQRLAHATISKLNILEILKQYRPIVVGTIPIEIDIPDSDLDIICNVDDLKDFQNLIQYNFRKCNEFSDKIDDNHYLAHFIFNELQIEIYAENKSTVLQNAYLHMIIENRLLNLFGSSFKGKVISLKLQGYKTEPAFGHILGLNNAYEDLLELAKLSDNQLLSKFSTKTQ